MIDIVRFLKDYRVPHATEGDKHCRPGWVQVACPFCPGSKGWHLGHNLKEGYWNCWRCGHHRQDDVARALTGVSWGSVAERYRAPGGLPLPRAKSRSKRPLLSQASLPLGCGPMGPRHHAYLQSRRFDSHSLERIWNLMGTGPVGPDKLRVVAPVYHNERLVTWQARDITGQAMAKYRACPPDKEARPIKHCLYGLDKVDPTRGCVVVEGIADVWRLGPGAVATFGTQFSVAQLHLLLDMARVFLLFDSGEAAAAQFSLEFATRLTEAGVPEVHEVNLGSGDPGEMDQDEADRLMRSVGMLL